MDTPNDAAGEAAENSSAGAAPQPDDAAQAEQTATADDCVPMMREPTHIPGQHRGCFSPFQFLALTQTRQLDADVDEGFWLTQHDAPEITTKGIHFADRLFWSAELQPFIDALEGGPARTFVIRYDRARLARGVLDQIILLERDAVGGYVERCRCGLKHEVVPEIDMNTVLAERQRLTRLFIAKRGHAELYRLMLERGDREVERLRDEQAARTRRQRVTKHPPKGAAPITYSPEAEARRAQAEATERMAEHLDTGAAEAGAGNEWDVPTARDPESTPAGRKAAEDLGTGPAPSSPSSKGASRHSSRSGNGSRRSRGGKGGRSPAQSPDIGPANEPQSDAERGKRTQSIDTLAEQLGGTTGFAKDEDD